MNKRKWQPGEESLKLLMTNHSREEGQCLWEAYEKTVNSENAPAVPEHLDQACKEDIKEYFSKKPKEKRHSKVLSTISRLAACAALALIIVTATLLSADADSNIHVDRFLQNSCSLSELKNRYVIHLRLYPGSETQDVDAIRKVMESLTAKGYSLQQEYTNHSATAEHGEMGLYSLYKNEQGQTVRLDCRKPLSGVIIVYKQEDTYASQSEHLGYNMIMVEEGSSRQIHWLDDAEGLCYSLYTDGLSESDFWDLVYGLAQK